MRLLSLPLTHASGAIWCIGRHSQDSHDDDREPLNSWFVCWSQPLSAVPYPTVTIVTVVLSINLPCGCPCYPNSSNGLATLLPPNITLSVYPALCLSRWTADGGTASRSFGLLRLLERESRRPPRPSRTSRPRSPSADHPFQKANHLSLSLNIYIYIYILIQIICIDASNSSMMC